MNACENITRLSRELGVSRGLLYTWRYRLEPPDADVEGTVSTQNSRESRLRREVNKLKQLLADKTVEVDFFRSALQNDEARRQQSDISGEKVSTTQFEMPLQGNLSIERMCQLTQVSRAGVLPLSSGPGVCGRGHDNTICYSEDCSGTRPLLRISPRHGRTASTRNDGESQTRGSAGRCTSDGVRFGSMVEILRL